MAMSAENRRVGRMQKAKGSAVAGHGRRSSRTWLLAVCCPLLSAFLLLDAGCARAPKVRGQTMMPKRARVEAWQRIVAIEADHRPDCRPRIMQTEVVQSEGGTVVERWVVRGCDRNLDYLVRLVPSGRTREIRISPPSEFAPPPIVLEQTSEGAG